MFCWDKFVKQKPSLKKFILLEIFSAYNSYCQDRKKNWNESVVDNDDDNGGFICFNGWLNWMTMKRRNLKKNLPRSSTQYGRGNKKKSSLQKNRGLKQSRCAKQAKLDGGILLNNNNKIRTHKICLIKYKNAFVDCKSNWNKKQCNKRRSLWKRA